MSKVKSLSQKIVDLRHKMQHNT